MPVVLGVGLGSGLMGYNMRFLHVGCSFLSVELVIVGGGRLWRIITYACNLCLAAAMAGYECWFETIGLSCWIS